MALFLRSLTGCALCLLFGSLIHVSAQSTSSTKRHTPADATAQELQRLLVAAADAVRHRAQGTPASSGGCCRSVG